MGFTLPSELYTEIASHVSCLDTLNNLYMIDEIQPFITGYVIIHTVKKGNKRDFCFETSSRIITNDSHYKAEDKSHDNNSITKKQYGTQNTRKYHYFRKDSFQTILLPFIKRFPIICFKVGCCMLNHDIDYEYWNGLLALFKYAGPLTHFRVVYEERYQDGPKLKTFNENLTAYLKHSMRKYEYSFLGVDFISADGDIKHNYHSCNKGKPRELKTYKSNSLNLFRHVNNMEISKWDCSNKVRLHVPNLSSLRLIFNCSPLNRKFRLKEVFSQLTTDSLVNLKSLYVQLHVTKYFPFQQYNLDELFEILKQSLNLSDLEINIDNVNISFCDYRIMFTLPNLKTVSIHLEDRSLKAKISFENTNIGHLRCEARFTSIKNLKISPNLEKLEIVSHKSIPNGLSYYYFPKLEELSISITAYSNIKKLNIKYRNISLPNLRKLSLYIKENVEDIQFILFNCPKLEHLKYSQTKNNGADTFKTEGSIKSCFEEYERRKQHLTMRGIETLAKCLNINLGTR